MPPRNPTAASAKSAPEAIPSKAGRHEKISPPARAGQDSKTTPTVAMKHGGGQRQGHRLAEKDQRKESDLHWLGFRVGDRHHERTLTHRGQHKCCCHNLTYRTEERPQ